MPVEGPQQKTACESLGQKTIDTLKESRNNSVCVSWYVYMIERERGNEAMAEGISCHENSREYQLAK